MSYQSMFSVVTPVRNGMPLIQRCVGSVRQQGPVLYEHLIHDAVSTDETAVWCASQSDLDCISEHDSGMYDAINRGWARAKGDYLSWLNADEQYLPGTLALVQDAFDTNLDVDVVFGDAIIVADDGRAIAYRREAPLRASYVKNSFLYIYSCTLFYRRRLLDQGYLNLDSNFRYAADMDLILRLLEQGVRFLDLQKPLALYTASGTNLSTHAGMQSETRDVQARYGGFQWGALRSITRIPRWIERALAGGFLRRNGEYAYVPDASSPNQIVRYKNLSARYSVFRPE